MSNKNREVAFAGRRVTVIGCGLVGASVALALREGGARVAGWDSSARVLQEALARGVIDQVDEAFNESSVSDADLVYLAAPVGGIIEFLRERGPQCKRGAIITDAGSTKEQVCAAARDYLPEGRAFVGGHPMAGSHLSGVEHARADLFAGAPYVLIADGVNVEGGEFRTVQELVEKLGAWPLLMSAGEHDRAVAFVSHLPQLLSSALAAVVNEEDEAEALTALAGRGYADMTRLAGSAWSVWRDILMTNALPIAEALDAFGVKLAAVRDELRRAAAGGEVDLKLTAKLFDDS